MRGTRKQLNIVVACGGGSYATSLSLIPDDDTDLMFVFKSTGVVLGLDDQQ